MLLQKLVNSLGQERCSDLNAATQQHVLCRMISLRTKGNLASVVGVVVYFLFYLKPFFSGLQMKRLLTTFCIGLYFTLQNLVWKSFNSFSFAPGKRTSVTSEEL